MALLGGMQGFITFDWWSVLQVFLLGLIGGVLSGFIGSGGAFFMTPGMMNLGVPGAIAVGSNITHKFGKALVGSLRHRQLGNVDRKLALYMTGTSFVGIRIAAWINELLFRRDSGSGSSSSAASDLYISVVFVTTLTVVAAFMLTEVSRSLKGTHHTEERSASGGLARYLSWANLPPMVYFQVSEARVSLWPLLVVGLFTGYMAGTIGVGGFLGVPAMIYLFGVPTTVAAGTELYLAMFMGGFGAINYVWQGMVDVRLTLILYGGSLIGVLIGAYGTRIVKALTIRLVTGVVIAICVVSRLVAIPVYLRQLGALSFDAAIERQLNWVSTGLLYAAGCTGLTLILVFVIRAHRQRMRVHASLLCSAVRPAHSASHTA